ncbi:hypothetical protein ACP4OV_020038 [Aristida adscensionis]
MMSTSDYVLLHGDALRGNALDWNGTTARAYNSQDWDIEVSMSCPERLLVSTVLFMNKLPGVDFTQDPPRIVCAVQDLIGVDDNIFRGDLFGEDSQDPEDNAGLADDFFESPTILTSSKESTDPGNDTVISEDLRNGVRHLILLRVPLVDSDMYDYFIYRPGGASLQLIPHAPITFHDEDVGLLRRGEEHYIIAALIATRPEY